MTANTPVAVPLTCSDANLDPVTLEKVANPTAGNLADTIDQAQGTVLYSPLPGFTGQDSFMYRGSARGAAPPATVTLNVIAQQVGGAAGIIDADGDGFASGQDCNDRNPRIRPNAREIRGNGVDENCDNRLGLGRIGSLVRSDWLSFLDHTEIVSLRAPRTPAGARGQIRCLGRGCKFKRRNVKRKGRAIDFRAALPRAFRSFAVGQTIEVRITRRFYAGKVVRYKLLPRAVPAGRTLCLPPGGNRPRKRCQPFL